jgi:hypothetical protein
MQKPTSHKKISPALGKMPLASGIAVFCAHDKIVPSETLKPYPKNPKQHPPKQLDRYELVVAGDGNKPGNGWRRAIVVSPRSGFITKGHGAWQMAMRRGWDVPVEYQQYGSEAEELRDLVADNRLAELAETDDEKLAALLQGLENFDLTLAGFDNAELEQLIRQAEKPPEGQFPITAKLNESYDYVLIFTDNTSDFLFLQTLCGVQTERSYKKTGIGLGRAVPFKRFLKAIHENRHSINVQGDHDHDASAAPKRDRVRAKKPAKRIR